MRGEQVDDAALQAVGVLELVHEQVLEAAPVVFERGRVGLEHAQPEHEQVVEVADVALLLGRLVGVAEAHELLGAALHPVEALGDDLGQRAQRVAGVRIGVEDDRGLRVGLVLDESPVGRLDDLREQLFGFLLVEDGEVGRTAGREGVAAQDALADGVERPAPELAAGDPGEVLDALEHLLGGLVGERQEQDVPGLGPLVQQPGHAVGQRPGLARTCAGEHERGARRGGHRRVLFRVQFGPEVDRRQAVHGSGRRRGATGEEVELHGLFVGLVG